VALEGPEHLDPLNVDGSTGPACTSTTYNVMSSGSIPELNPGIRVACARSSVAAGHGDGGGARRCAGCGHSAARGVRRPARGDHM